MRSQFALSLSLSVAVAAGSILVSAQGGLLPSQPKKGFGTSIAPAYDGWYDNADGSHTFLIGYYNRNWKADVDIPIGPNNHFEPGNPDRGQPTHFLPNRNFGMFSVTVPKDTPPGEKLWWVLTLNGVTQRVPFHRSPDYNITPQHASEEGADGRYNRPPLLSFAATGPMIQNPVATVASALHRTAVANRPMPLEMWVKDDALFASGSNGPIGSNVPPIVELVVAKYRGPGVVTVANGHEKMTTLKGGKVGEAYEGKASTTVTFSEPGDYLIHVTANDLSGKGGGATACCWTTALINVAVTPSARNATTGGH